MGRITFITALRASCAAAAFACVSQAHAQEAPLSTELQPSDGEIVVTATRTAQVLSDVPMSVSAFSQDKMDTFGVKTIADIATLTPGVTFTQRKAIAIRGILSNAGAGTTGIYIDDTPIQLYKVGAFVTEAVPGLFDLDRVEVLRGPQGTLFGSGSMGGTVRYITPQPSLTDYSVYGRGELSFVAKGGANFEGGLAAGGPIALDKLGFRASAYYRRDGGWIDRVDRNTGELADKESNWGENYALRGALTWMPFEGVKLTPAIFHQYRFTNASVGYPVDTGDGGSASYEALSDPSEGVFVSGARIPSPGTDRSTLYSLTTNIEIGSAELISSTSYYDRTFDNILDGSVYDSWFIGADGSNGFTSPTQVFLGGFGFDWNSYNELNNKQKSFAQEVRIVSDQSKPFRWTIGAFYESNKQRNTEEFHAPSLNEYLPVLGLPEGDYTVRGDLGYYGFLRSKNSQIAGFAQVDYDVTDELTLTAGIRKAELKYSFYGENDGFYNGGLTTGSGNSKDSPWTPKFGLQFEPNDDHLFYVNVAKGFRTGGANAPIAADRCNADLAAAGFSEPPATYDSDSVWNYEVGAKNSFFDRRLQISSSVFRVDWSQIQSRLFLPCGFITIANLGEARSQGFDLQLTARVNDNFTLSGNVGYNHAEYKTTILTSADNLVTEGDRLPVSPWTAAVIGDVTFDLWNKPSYIHAEYRYQSGYPNLIEQNPLNATYNPDYYDRPAIHLVNMRVGMEFDAFNVSVFADNLFNKHTTIGRASDHIGSPLFIINNLRPRVLGVTVTYRD